MNEVETKVNEKPNSFKVSINAKGQWSGEVKVYEKTPELAMQCALKRAKELEILIKEKNGGD